MAVDFAEVRGQEAAKRALMVAMALAMARVGRVNVLLCGPRGCGKTMLQQAAEGVVKHIDAARITVRRLEVPADKAAAVEAYRTALADERPDMVLEVPRVTFRELMGKGAGTDTATIVAKLRESGSPETHKAITKLRKPGGLSGALDGECMMLMRQAYEELKMSPADVVTALEIAYAIAALEGVAKLEAHHVAEAIQYLPRNSD